MLNLGDQNVLPGSLSRVRTATSKQVMDEEVGTLTLPIVNWGLAEARSRTGAAWRGCKPSLWVSVSGVVEILVVLLGLGVRERHLAAQWGSQT